MVARIGKLPARKVESNPATTPFDMLNVRVGDQTVLARPYETVVDRDSGKEYPSKAVTTCPVCGHGINIDIRLDQILTGVSPVAACDNCGAGKVIPPPPLEDPFHNPLIGGLIARSDLDPLYGDPAALVTQKPAAESVRERRRKSAAAKGADTSAVAPKGQDEPAKGQEEPVDHTPSVELNDLLGGPRECDGDALALGEEP